MTADSPWQRRVASQLLIESERDHADQLGEMVRSAEVLPEARARAAWILRRMRRLGAADLRALTESRDARLRAMGVRLAGERTADLELVRDAIHDQDPIVLLAAAQAAGSRDDHPEQRVTALAAIARNAEDDQWTGKAIATIHAELVHGVAETMVDTADLDVHSELLAHLVERLATAAPLDAARLVIRANRDVVAGNEPLTAEPAQLIQAWIFRMPSLETCDPWRHCKTGRQ